MSVCTFTKGFLEYGRNEGDPFSWTCLHLADVQSMLGSLGEVGHMVYIMLDNVSSSR